MAEIDRMSAKDYDTGTVQVVKSVLVEIAQILGSFKGKYVVIGGAVPWLQPGDPDMPHVGTVDVDLSLDAEALGDSEYARLVEELMGHGYVQQRGRRRFQLVRTVPMQDGGADIDVVVDFLRPHDAEITKNKPPLIDGFATQRAHGAELAHEFYEEIEIDAEMPGGGKNKASIAVASVPAFLAMKGYALAGRKKYKDAYDIYYCVRNYPGGIDCLVEATRPLLENKIAAEGYRLIAGKFRSTGDYGPTCVRYFVEGPPTPDGRTPAQWQTDAHGQVSTWLSGLGLMK